MVGHHFCFTELEEFLEEIAFMRHHSQDIDLFFFQIVRKHFLNVCAIQRFKDQS